MGKAKANDSERSEREGPEQEPEAAAYHQAVGTARLQCDS